MKASKEWKIMVKSEALFLFQSFMSKAVLVCLIFLSGKGSMPGVQLLAPNPTDNINPYDLIDPIEGYNINNDRKIGVYSASIKAFFPNWKDFEFPTLEFIFVPRFNP